jgi:hypothetical protein
MSNAGIKRKLGCPFFWLRFLWASKEKELAEWRKGMVKDSPRLDSGLRQNDGLLQGALAST